MQVAEEQFSNIRTVRAFGQEKRELQAYQAEVERVLNFSYKEALATGAFWGSVRYK